jgi:hypothetical protein
MAQAVSSRSLIAEARLRGGSVHVRLVVDKMALEQVLLQSSSVFPSQYNSTRAPHSYIIVRPNNRPVGGRSSETRAHSIDDIRCTVEFRELEH